MTPAEAARNKYRCPRCEHPLEEVRGTYYCPKCGHDMEEVMTEKEALEWADKNSDRGAGYAVLAAAVRRLEAENERFQDVWGVCREHYCSVISNACPYCRAEAAEKERDELREKHITTVDKYDVAVNIIYELRERLKAAEEVVGAVRRVIDSFSGQRISIGWLQSLRESLAKYEEGRG